MIRWCKCRCLSKAWTRNYSRMRTITIIVMLALFAVQPLAAESSDPVIDQAKALINAGQGNKAVEIM